MASPSIRINLPRQELVLEKSGKILLQCPVSSGKAGTGHEEGSGKTPTGHFRIWQPASRASWAHSSVRPSLGLNRGRASAA